jgi:hypothetical protein
MTKVYITDGHKGRTLRYPSKSHPCSAETRKKMSAALTGKKKSESHRAAISAGRKGIKFSPELCAAISQERIGRVWITSLKNCEESHFWKPEKAWAAMLSGEYRWGRPKGCTLPKDGEK